MTRQDLDALIRDSIWDGIVIGGVTSMAVVALANIIVWFS